MQRKNIRRSIRKQLKTNFPGWKKMNKKQKKALVREIMKTEIDNYDFSQPVESPIEELLGIEDQMPSKGILTLKGMADYINNFYSGNLFPLESKMQTPKEITDKELIFIDELLDNEIIDSLLATEGYSPDQRDTRLYQLFRMELLKVIKYPEISYRKYCTEEYFGRERKQNRRFAGLPLNTKKIPDHTELCHFRQGLPFPKLVNILLYILHHLYESNCLDDWIVHGIDSTELPMEFNYPLCTIEVKGKKIRIYSDIDCDCGKRRNKRDKSPYVIGYRMHTLTAINPSTGHSFPLVSLIGAANHHDSLFLKPLIQLAQAMGIDVKLITADQAYHDTDGSLFNETGTYVIAPPLENTALPDNVVNFPVRVTCNDYCEHPMNYICCTPEGHEYGCSTQPGECPHDSACLKRRIIPFDRGYFQPMPVLTKQAEKIIAIRKNCERPFNLMKKREGLEQTRVRSQHGVVARSIFTTIATLLIEMAGTRRKNKKKDDKQLNIFDKAS